jgi:hypothetical protein
MATLPKVLISRADYQIGGGVALGLRTQGLARIDHSLPAIPVEPFTTRVRVVLFEQERVEDAGASIGYPALTAGGTPMRMTVTAGVHYPGCSSTVARKGGHLIDLAWVEGHLWEPAARSP